MPAALVQARGGAIRTRITAEVLLLKIDSATVKTSEALWYQHVGY